MSYFGILSVSMEIAHYVETSTQKRGGFRNCVRVESRERDDVDLALKLTIRPHNQ